jgi:CheY-like chemotaxis protein
MKKRVLCVDDVFSNLDLIHRVVAHMNRYEVVAVSTGQAALDEATKQAPDLVVIDLRMPVMDGYALVAHLRHLPELKHCRYIALSADVSDATYVKCLATGFDHYVRKPFEVDDMQALIASLLD